MHILEGISDANDDGDLPPMEDRFSIEISHYEGEEPTSESLIEWWAKNQFRYPLLLQLARQYLAAGHIISEKRLCLLPENVNKLVFLAENIP